MPTYQGSTVVKRRPKDGEPGPPGEQGPLMVQKEWVQGDTHRYTDEVREYFYVRGADAAQSFWYTLINKGTVIADAPPTGGIAPAGYKNVQWLKELSVQFFIAEEANLANLIFKDQKLISLRGTVNGVAADYSGQANFEPNIIIDGKNGKITAIDATIRGTIDAVSGELGNLTLKQNGYIKLPPAFLFDQVGRIDTNGINLVSDGYYSQKIEWLIGDIYNIAKIQPDTNARLKIESDYGVMIESDGDINIESDGDINIGTTKYDYTKNIRIGNYTKTINFDNSILDNVNIKKLKLGYESKYINYAGYISLISLAPICILTPGVSGIKIFKIMGYGGEEPSIGEIKILINDGNTKIYLDPNHANSNIRTHASAGKDFDLNPHSAAFLVYSFGYWYVQTDAGQ